MLCSRCGTEVASDASYCSRCGLPLAGVADAGSMEHRHEEALIALEARKDASEVQCPECGGYHMRMVRKDAEENLFWSVALMGAGVASLVIVVVAGDASFIVANLSTIALLLLLVGALLFAVARWRRRPIGYECLDCGCRVP